MRRFIFTVFALSMTCLVLPAQAFAQDGGAKVLYSGSKIGFTAHTSLFDVEGVFSRYTLDGKVDGEAFQNSSVRVQIEASSVDTGNSSRDDHLRTPDFFAAKKFPQLVFQTTKITGSNGAYKVEGDLTIRGQTHPVSLLMKTSIEDTGKVRILRAKGTTKINRRKFNVNYEAGVFTPSVDDMVDLNIDLRFLI